MSQVRHYFGRAKQGVMLVVLGLFSFSVAQATESILDFHSDISVNRDGSIEVIETITVNAEGRDIRRGIYRDLPTDYEHPQYGKFGFKSKAPISVVSVQRNGVDEPYHTQDLDNGLRVFFGSASRYLKHGKHTYRLRYTAERQIAVSDSTARLYWNVTGNGWMFPIQRASAKIHLPGQSSVYQQDVFTGYQGSSSTDALFDSADDADIFIQSAKPLLARQGMTVKVQFDASELVLPEQSELALLYYDNALWFWGVGLLALMVILLFFFWVRIGRDPQRGIVIAQYRPVKDLSAAAHRAVFRNRVDDTSFSVGVLSAAIKGWLTISEPSKKTFKLTSTEANQADRKPLSPSENLLVKGLFNGRDSVTLDGEYDSRLKTLKSRYDDFLQKEFANKSHQPHTAPLVLGGLVGIVGWR